MLEMPEFRTVRGMRDFLPDEAHLLRRVENRAREVARLYGYGEIVTPLVESYELLSAKAGEEVKSRMFVFKDLGGRDVALRPEFTASVARLVATTLRNEPKPFRLFCFGSVYRYDEPQRGRYREIWQSNYELMGSDKPEADAEILMLTNSLMQAAGLKRFTFKVGHIGILRAIMTQERLSEKTQNAVLQQMDKKQYEDALRLIQDAGASENCAATLQKLVRLKGTDVCEVVDGIVKLVRSYKASVEAAKNLGEVLTLVSNSGCNMNVSVEAGFARGLEYYTGMIFEVYAPGLDVALSGGGRYDRLIELFGGESTPAVGVAHGIDRMMLALQGQEAARKVREKKSVLVIPVRAELRAEALRVSLMLRDAGVPVEIEVMGRKIAKALEDADRREMGYAVIIGERELKEGAVVVRDLATREQSMVKVEDVVEAVKG
jgi:histidyl-tRNA synthetase